jgi:hypothetical protein
MSAFAPLTKVAAYSAARRLSATSPLAGGARAYRGAGQCPRTQVFMTEQLKFLHIDETGELLRARKVIARTPMG